MQATWRQRVDRLELVMVDRGVTAPAARALGRLLSWRCAGSGGTTSKVNPPLDAQRARWVSMGTACLARCRPATPRQ